MIRNQIYLHYVTLFNLFALHIYMTIIKITTSLTIKYEIKNLYCSFSYTHNNTTINSQMKTNLL